MTAIAEATTAVNRPQRSTAIEMPTARRLSPYPLRQRRLASASVPTGRPHGAVATAPAVFRRHETFDRSLRSRRPPHLPGEPQSTSTGNTPNPSCDAGLGLVSVATRAGRRRAYRQKPCRRGTPTASGASALFCCACTSGKNSVPSTVSTSTAIGPRETGETPARRPRSTRRESRARACGTCGYSSLGARFTNLAEWRIQTSQGIIDDLRRPRCPLVP